MKVSDKQKIKQLKDDIAKLRHELDVVKENEQHALHVVKNFKRALEDLECLADRGEW